MTQPIRIRVLLVEDSADDAFVMQEAANEVAGLEICHHAPDGPSALSFLRREGEHAGAPRPDVVLLDVNMPGMDGYAVLRAIREDDALNGVPVVMLTSSSSLDDLKRAYAAGAVSFITKPIEFAETVRCVNMFVEYWTSVSRLPVPPADGP